MEAWLIIMITISSGLLLFIILFVLKKRRCRNREIHNRTTAQVLAVQTPQQQQMYTAPPPQMGQHFQPQVVNSQPMGQPYPRPNYPPMGQPSQPIGFNYQAAGMPQTAPYPMRQQPSTQLIMPSNIPTTANQPIFMGQQPGFSGDRYSSAVFPKVYTAY